MKVVFLEVEEELIDFLNRRKIKYSEVMLCPCCINVFDKEVEKELEKNNPYQSRKDARQDQHREFFFNKRGVTQKTQKPETYVSPYNVPPREWVGPIRRPTADMGKWKLIEFGMGSLYHDNSQKKHSYIPKKYMGKNPMTRTHWRRHKRNKKLPSK